MKQKAKVEEIIKAIDEKNAQQKHEEKITKEFLIIESQSRLIGIQIEYLREVFDVKDDNEISPIPFTPSYILGIINVRGEIIPVLSLSELLHIEEKEFNLLKIVVIENQWKIAFPVKSIVDMKAIEVKNIRAIKDVTIKTEEQFISDEFEYKGTIVSILDIPKLYLSSYLL